MPTDPVITQEIFDELLAWLDPDREQAGGRYEDLRRSLIKIFAWRGCLDAEGLADDTINRVANKVRELRTSYQGDPRLYFYAVANNLIKEDRRHRKLQAPIEEVTLVSFSPKEEEEEEVEREYECLRQCLQRLSPEERDLVIDYYLEEKQAKIDHRKELARQRGVGTNALRVRMYRIRTFLEDCIERCLRQPGPNEMN